MAGHLGLPAAPVDRDGFAKVDLIVDAGRIAAVAPAGTLDLGDTPRLALGGRIVWPLFIDAHTHLDKGHIWRRTPNPTRDFPGALTAVGNDREARWSAEDVAARMEFGLQCAYAHGTRAIRTHLDSGGRQTGISFPVFAEARERWRGKIDLQASPLFGVDMAFEPGHLQDVEAMIDAHGSRLLGAVTYMVPKLRRSLEALFALAERKQWDLDFHVDETADPAARSLAVIAEIAIARRFPGKILVGHCCSLANQADDERQRTIELVAKAGLSVVSLPMCNMFLQDRHPGRTPRWRGVTALHELAAAGVNVLIASDNTRDPFYAYGDLDMLEVLREGVRILHLDHPFADWAQVVGASPARAMGLNVAVLEAGASADFILTAARDFHRTAFTTAWRPRRRARRPRDRRGVSGLCRPRQTGRPRPMSAYDISAFSRKDRRDPLRGQSDSCQTEEPGFLLVLARAEARTRRRHGRRPWSRQRARWK